MDAARGLYQKYRVTRLDGTDAPGMKHADCDYFVLDLTHDLYARMAVRAYAAACAGDLPALAADLWARLGPELENDEPLPTASEIASAFAICTQIDERLRNASICSTLVYDVGIPLIRNALAQLRVQLGSEAHAAIVREKRWLDMSQGMMVTRTDRLEKRAVDAERLAGQLRVLLAQCRAVLDGLEVDVDVPSETLARWGDVLLIDLRRIVGRSQEARKGPVPRPAAEWTEEDGPVLWWKPPVCEPPYSGTPLDSDWPGYHTHWTPFVVPQDPPREADVAAGASS